MSASRDPIVDLVASMPGRSTRAIVDLDAIVMNVETVARDSAPGMRICAVVKADGYGHGAIMVARAALMAGASMVGVATVGEAANLRNHGLAVPILILGPIDESEIPRAISLDCELMIGDVRQLEVIQATPRLEERAPAVHLKIDTGMHRYGCAPSDAVALAKAIDISGLKFAGIATHFHSADEPEVASASTQARLFFELVDQIQAAVAQQPSIHLANSAGTLRNLSSRSAIIRLGVAMYGLQPGSGSPLLPSMRPALSVISRLARVHMASAGEGVSYGHTYRETADERLGLVPLGYADGYPRVLSNQAWMAVDGHRCPDRGRICMDQTVIGDLSATATLRDIVGVMGPLGGGPSLDDLADLAGTINYEIAASLSPRIARYYVRSGQVVAVLSEGRLETFGT